MLIRLGLQAHTSLYMTIIQVTSRTGLRICLKLLVFVKDRIMVLINFFCFVLCFIK